MLFDVTQTFILGVRVFRVCVGNRSFMRRLRRFSPLFKALVLSVLLELNPFALLCGAASFLDTHNEAEHLSPLGSKPYPESLHSPPKRYTISNAYTPEPLHSKPPTPKFLRPQT